MNSATIRMRTENVTDTAKLKSSSQVGIGRISTTRIETTPSASAISPRRSDATSRSIKAEGDGVDVVAASVTAGSRGHGGSERPLELVGRRRDRPSLEPVLLQLVAERADRNAEDVSGVRAVPEA